MTQSATGHLLGASNTALLLTGLMLPVGGVIARLVACAFVARFANPLQLAAALPPGELASVGAMPILTIATSFLVAWRVASMARGWKWGRILGDRRFLIAMAVALGTGVLILEVPSIGFGSAVSIYALVLLSSWLGLKERFPLGAADSSASPIRGARLAAILAVIYALSAVAYGFGGRLGPSGHVVGPAAAALGGGPVLRVGEDADWLYFGPCASRGEIIQVAKPDVTSIHWEVPAVRSDTPQTDVYRTCP